MMRVCLLKVNLRGMKIVNYLRAHLVEIILFVLNSLDEWISLEFWVAWCQQVNWSLVGLPISAALTPVSTMLKIVPDACSIGWGEEK